MIGEVREDEPAVADELRVVRSSSEKVARTASGSAQGGPSP